MTPLRPPTNKGIGRMMILFLGGILRVWGLGPRQHWVGLYWDHWVHWDGTEICAGGALGLQWEHWKLWHLSWECFGSFGPVVRRALELHSEPQDPYWGDTENTGNILVAHTGRAAA